MRLQLGSVVGLLLAASVSAAAQGADPLADSARVLILEHQFQGLTDTAVVTLDRRVVYWAEVSGGQEAPAFQPVRGSRWPALVVPVGEQTADGIRGFEVHPSSTGAHVVSLPDVAPGTPATLRLYRNQAETDRLAAAHDRDFAVGLLLGGGFHTAYRLDPVDPGHPGGDVEGCLLAETGGRFGACLGIGRQMLPHAGYALTWFFIEPRARLASGSVIGSSRTDLGAALRLAQASESGPRNESPSLIAFALYITQHLAAEERRRGWRLYSAWHYGRLGNVAETEHRSTHRFTAGLMWVP